MKIFTLLYHENSDCCDKAEVVYCGCSHETASELLRDKYEKSLAALRHDMERNEDGYSCSGSPDYASIVEGLDNYTWEIEEHDVEPHPTDLVVEVSGGMVQNIYATNQINKIRVDVRDEDVIEDENEDESDMEPLTRAPKKVYLVTKGYPDLDLVNDDLEVSGHDVGEVVAVCGTQEKAEKYRNEFQTRSDENVAKYDCDKEEFGVAAWEVE